MMCTGCESLLSGLVGGFISLISFILIPVSEIFFALIKMVFEKVRVKQ